MLIVMEIRAVPCTNWLRRDAVAQTLGDLQRILGGDPGQNDCEFLATEPADQIDTPHAGSQPRYHMLECFIADRMAGLIVDDLEVVDVDHHYAKPLGALACPGKLAFAEREKLAPIERAGQRIRGRQTTQLYLQLAVVRRSRARAVRWATSARRALASESSAREAR